MLISIAGTPHVSQHQVGGKRNVLSLQKVILALRLNLIPCCASYNWLVVPCDQRVVLWNLLLLLLLLAKRSQCQARSRVAGRLICPKRATSTLFQKHII